MAGGGHGVLSVRAHKIGGAGTSSGQHAGNSQELATDAVALAGVSATQLQQLLAFFNFDKIKDRLHGKNSHFSWIIDTGASNHVTCDLSILKNVRKVQYCPVGLPNGNTVEANQEGSVVLPGGLKLDNVLYVPQLTCNLISVTQLIDESNCVVQFTHNICVIQDQPTRKVIGAGERLDGLYFFRGVPQVKVLTVDGDSSFELWHQRMGHPSEKILKMIPAEDWGRKFSRSIAELIGEESILCASMEQHRLLRNLLTNFFTTESMSASIRHFDELTKKTLSNWKQRGTVIVLEDALKITFDSMCNFLMSLEYSNEMVMLQKDVAQVFEAMLAVPMNLPWTTFSKGLKARKRIMDTLGKIIERRRQAIEKQKKVDLLQFLLREEKSCDSSLLLTDKQIQENILTLIIAGQETTANAITWMVKYLDENQEVRETLRDEQLKIEDKSTASSLTIEALNEMSYASQVVKESLRMASIVPWFPRVALKDCEVEGFKIKKGWIINIDAKALHLDPSVYKDPTKFCPRRFEGCSKLYSFLAFGTGARTCLGMNLSKAMMLVFLHRFITTYRWKVIDSDSNLEKMALFSRLRSGCPVNVVPVS